MEAKLNEFLVLYRKPERKRPLGTRKRRYKYNIKMDLRKVGCENVA
jgi:hypothetical protein